VQRPYNAAAHWRERAEEARALAAVMMTPSARREMLQIAIAYEMLAERAERTARLLARAALGRNLSRNSFCSCSYARNDVQGMLVLCTRGSLRLRPSPELLAAANNSARTNGLKFDTGAPPEPMEARPVRIKPAAVLAAVKARPLGVRASGKLCVPGEGCPGVWLRAAKARR
jgi:hypothetical protein